MRSLVRTITNMTNGKSLKRTKKENLFINTGVAKAVSPCFQSLFEANLSLHTNAYAHWKPLSTTEESKLEFFFMCVRTHLRLSILKGYIWSNLGLSVLPRDTSTCSQHFGSNQRPSNEWMTLFTLRLCDSDCLNLAHSCFIRQSLTDIKVLPVLDVSI